MKPLTYRHTRIACYGAYVTQAIINNLAPLLFTIFQRRFGVTLEEVGSLILINFTAQIFVDLAAAGLPIKSDTETEWSSLICFASPGWPF